MTAYDTVVRHGLLVTPDGTSIGDIAVKDGTIAWIGPEFDGEAATEIDATGRVVVPGGIDCHTHFDTEAGDLGRTADDYESGTRAAAAGGITTIINYAFPGPGDTLLDVVERERLLAEPQAHIDFSFHPVITPLLGGDVETDLPLLAEAGFPSVKVFNGSQFRLTESEILRVLAAAADAGVLVAVHPEDEALTEFLIQRRRQAGPLDPERAAEDFQACHPPTTESAAVAQIGAYARQLGASVYFVHLSCAEAVEALDFVKRCGTDAYGETRPAYLFLDGSRYGLPEREGTKFVCLPPLREVDDQEALWKALNDELVSTVASDHTSWTAAQKKDPARDFTNLVAGFASVQTWYGMLYAEGVGKGRLSVERFVEISSTNPAKIFGLYPTKGALVVGADADIVVLDPDVDVELEQADMQSRSDYDPYVGFAGRGWPAVVLSRGDVVMRDGTMTTSAGRGRLVRRVRA
ncbi:MAG: dihydropyrimidinase [Blastococcus sp.]|jgi:dihydropyrimidinase|nr:dihydropyrimidinase [Blastococcus sp.]